MNLIFCYQWSNSTDFHIAYIKNMNLNFSKFKFMGWNLAARLIDSTARQRCTVASSNNQIFIFTTTLFWVARIAKSLFSTIFNFVLPDCIASYILINQSFAKKDCIRKRFLLKIWYDSHSYDVNVVGSTATFTKNLRM